MVIEKTVRGPVAVISDIHGNLPALEAVLAEPEVLAADLIIVAGDHAAGPLPKATLNCLRELGDRAILIQGNADRELVDLAHGQESEAPDISRWAASQLNLHDIALLAGLPHPLTIDINGFGPTIFCHATVRSLDEIVLVNTPISRWQEIFADLAPEVKNVVCGHTHMPFMRLVAGRLVINPGSIGMPYGRHGAHWAILNNGAVNFHRTQFDINQAANQLQSGSSYPGISNWITTYLTSIPSDREALAAFTPTEDLS